MEKLVCDYSDGVKVYTSSSTYNSALIFIYTYIY